MHLDPERALTEAGARDAERAVGGRLGPLHGIPVTVKDIIDVAHMPTRCGSAAYEELPVRRRGGGGAPARGGGRGDRQGDHPRVRARGDDAPGAQPVRPHPHPGRLERRLGHRRRDRHRPGLARHRHARVDPGAAGALRRRRAQGDLRPGADGRRRHALLDDGPRRADRGDGGRRGADAGGPGPARRRPGPVGARRGGRNARRRARGRLRGRRRRGGRGGERGPRGARRVGRARGAVAAGRMPSTSTAPTARGW